MKPTKIIVTLLAGVFFTATLAYGQAETKSKTESAQSKKVELKQDVNTAKQDVAPAAQAQQPQPQGKAQSVTGAEAKPAPEANAVKGGAVQSKNEPAAVQKKREKKNDKTGPRQDVLKARKTEKKQQGDKE
jgi:hypothetical protein